MVDIDAKAQGVFGHENVSLSGMSFAAEPNGQGQRGKAQETE
ncbi:hypothetical protein SCH4B_2740 [Ruegeria sp. TrichCH4B]|nr:hypothetical protein SCH4B_2740 [Ruegeria sp. TrichCH4B]